MIKEVMGLSICTSSKELLYNYCVISDISLEYVFKFAYCEYKITITKMFLIHGKLNKHTSNKAQAEELKEKQALVIWNRAGRPTMHIGRPNTSQIRKMQKSSS